MAPRVLQFSAATVLVALSGSLVAATPDQHPDASEPARCAAYQEELLASRSHEHPIDLRDFDSMTDLVDDLLSLLPALTRYHRPGVQPQVFRVTRAQIEAWMCGGALCAMRAWYLPEQGIYLEDNLHPETDLFDRSVLLHELVHHLQELHGEGAELDACNRWYQREVQAYALQNRYLEMAGSRMRVTHPAYPCREAGIATRSADAAGAWR